MSEESLSHAAGAIANIVSHYPSSKTDRIANRLTANAVNLTARTAKEEGVSAAQLLAAMVSTEKGQEAQPLGEFVLQHGFTFTADAQLATMDGTPIMPSQEASATNVVKFARDGRGHARVAKAAGRRNR